MASSVLHCTRRHRAARGAVIVNGARPPSQLSDWKCRHGLHRWRQYAPDSCKYRYTRKFSSSLVIDMGQTAESCVAQRRVERMSMATGRGARAGSAPQRLIQRTCLSRQQRHRLDSTTQKEPCPSRGRKERLRGHICTGSRLPGAPHRRAQRAPGCQWAAHTRQEERETRASS